jgi:hypothetical protein
MNPNDRIFKINQAIRDVVRKRLSEFEDLFVSMAIEAYKDIVKNEPDDPFKELGNMDIVQSEEQSDENILFYEDEDEDEDEEEEVVVTTRTFHGKTYYTFLEDEEKEFTGIHERIITDDNESEVGDLAGYVDNEDRFWEAHTIDGKIAKYTYTGNDLKVTVPAKTDTFMRYPDIDFLKKK